MVALHTFCLLCSPARPAGSGRRTARPRPPYRRCCRRRCSAGGGSSGASGPTSAGVQPGLLGQAARCDCRRWIPAAAGGWHVMQQSVFVWLGVQLGHVGFCLAFMTLCDAGVCNASIATCVMLSPIQGTQAIMGADTRLCRLAFFPTLIYTLMALVPSLAGHPGQHGRRHPPIPASFTTTYLHS